MSTKQKKLDQLKSLDVPRVDWRSLIEKGSLSAEACGGLESQLEEYFSTFAAPQALEGGKGWKCISCGEELCLQWDLAHGEARCIRRTCRYPARIYHYKIPGHDKQVIVGLQYHPSVLTTSKEEAAS